VFDVRQGFQRSVAERRVLSYALGFAEPDCGFARVGLPLDAQQLRGIVKVRTDPLPRGQPHLKGDATIDCQGKAPGSLEDHPSSDPF